MSPKLKTFFRRQNKDIPNKENQRTDRARVKAVAHKLRALEAADTTDAAE